MKVLSQITILLIMLITGLIWLGLGARYGEIRTRNEAVKLGHATWIINKDGNSNFQWKEASK